MTVRRLLPLVAGLVATLALSACGSSDSSDDPASKGWSYQSASGETIELDHRPKRIIASASEAAGLIAYGIRPVGIYYATPPETEPGLKGVDLTGIKVIGKTWGKIDAEAAAELRPDLIVADWWPAQKAYQGFEEGVDAASLKVAKLAPTIGASQQGSLQDVLEWYEGFAKSVGVDTDTEKYTQGKQKFEDAKADFRAAVKAKPDVSALAVSPGDDLLYVAVPKYSTSLTDLKSWGLDVVDPDSPKKDFPYWEYLSWEKADKYQADFLMLDDRGYDDTIAKGERQPTWNKIKAAKAKAYTPWPGFWIHTYADYAASLEVLTKAVNDADENLA